MTSQSKVEVTEGNGFWICSRVTLPNGSYVQIKDLMTSGVVFQDDLVRQTPIGASHLAQTITSVTGTSSQSGLGNTVFDTLQTTYWDGYDGIGYNVQYFVNPSGTATDSTSWRLIGGNDYRLEFLLQTKAPPTPAGPDAATVGAIKWSVDVHVDGLET